MSYYVIERTINDVPHFFCKTPAERRWRKDMDEATYFPSLEDVTKVYDNVLDADEQVGATIAEVRLNLVSQDKIRKSRIKRVCMRLDEVLTPAELTVLKDVALELEKK